MFADHLGVELRMVVPDRFSDILTRVAEGEVDMGAAGLTVTEDRREHLRFGPPYQHITQQIVYRTGTPRPDSVGDLGPGRLEVVAGSSHEAMLHALSQRHPNLRWSANAKADSEELLYLVDQGMIDYTVADSNVVALNQRFYPELRVAFDLTEPQPLAWAFRDGPDDSLHRAATEFFEGIDADGRLAQLLERYYGHVRDFDYVGTRLYLRHITQRLPRFRPLFVEAGKQTNFDWRLLAAIGYQESHWRPDAISPTGVRGIMMLTLSTAQMLGIDNRIDPTHSIQGGARYFRRIKDRLPERIVEPDRTWLALAAYNVGLGHLEDARRLAAQAGGNPDRWVDVKANLPKLSVKKWYRRTEHGYARGREPVRYVENIRSYYDILVWHTEKDRTFREYRATPEIDAPYL